MAEIHDIRAKLAGEINSQAAPIYVLPLELLGMIGSHLKQRDLVRASLTSRHLCRALMGNGLLWTKIDFADPHLASASLERVPKSCPLNVSIPHPYLGADLLLPLKKYSNRIETLSVFGYSSSLGKIFDGARDSIKTLVINDSRGTFPQYTFPALESLTIRGHLVHLHAPLLTRFTFDGKLENKGLEEFLKLLPRFPELQELTVAHGQVGGGGGIVVLENLHTYTDQTDSVDYDLGLFNLLSLPKKRSVIFKRKFDYIGGPTGSIHRVPPSVNPKRIRIKMTHSHRQDESPEKVKDSADGLMEIFDATTHHWFFSTMRSSPEVVDWRYISSFASLATKNTETLCVEEDAGASYAPRELFARFENLKTLILSCSTVTSHLLALAPVRYTTYIPCPKLEHVFLCDRHDKGDNWQGTLEVVAEIVQQRRDLKKHREDAEGCQKFKSVRLFSPELRERGSPEVKRLVEQLKVLVDGGNFELVEGRRAEGWNVDEYFLEGLSIRNDTLS